MQIEREKDLMERTEKMFKVDRRKYERNPGIELRKRMIDKIISKKSR